jgi:hypothetical protein
VDAPLFHLAFVLGRSRPTRRDKEAVVLGALPVAALDLGVMERGVDDRGPEIVEDDAPRDPAEELEPGAVQAEPRRDRLVEHQLCVLVPAVRQGHHEHPGAADPGGLGIEDLAREAEVDLRLLTRLHFDPDCCGRCPRHLAA